MPRQNRVTPFGEIIATPERGTFMGNRGILHDEQGIVRRPWKLKRWLVCVLELRGRKRTVMAPNRYTELFFLDEATALAAGHRPCAECRHERFLAYCGAWKAAHSVAAERPRPSADEIDDQLHRERINRDRSKLLYEAKLKDLPDGVFVQNLDWSDDAYLILGQKLMKWTAGGYTEARRRPGKAQVLVLTPKSTVATILAGYAPEIHPSSVNSTRAPAS
jgi:hypothetical protein